MAVYKQSSLGHGAGVANITVTITPTAGNNIYTLAGCNSVSTAMSAGAVTDNKSQTHTSAGDRPKDTVNNDQVGLWYAKNVAGSATQFKFTPPSSADCDIAVAEFSGGDTSAPLGEHSSNTDNSNHATIDCGTITTTTANGVVVCGGTSVGNGTTATQPTSFLKAQEFLSTANMPLEMSYQLVTSTGTFHPVYTGVDSQANVGVVALFKDAAGGSDPFPAAYQPPSQMIESALLRM